MTPKNKKENRKKIFKNTFFCILTSSMIGSLSGLGFFILVFGVYGIFISIFFSGMISYLVGRLIENNFKWIRK